MSRPSLQQHYLERVIPELTRTYGYANRHQAPRLEKIVINTGIKADSDRNHLTYVLDELAKITGQRPVQTKARRSVSNFKLRQGQVIGAKATLRGRRLYEFLYRLINVALPCIRDFRGVPSQLDGNGNYVLGIGDHGIFPEISVETQSASIGMDVCMVTTAATDDEGRELLRLMGMPFRKSSSEERAEAVASEAVEAANV